MFCVILNLGSEQIDAFENGWFRSQRARVIQDRECVFEMIIFQLKLREFQKGTSKDGELRMSPT